MRQIIEGTPLEVEELVLQILSLPGHAHRQIALNSGEALCCADSIFGTDVLAKYGLPYATDVETRTESIKKLGDTNFRHYLPGHGALTDDIKPCCEANRLPGSRGWRQGWTPPEAVWKRPWSAMLWG